MLKAAENNIIDLLAALADEARQAEYIGQRPSDLTLQVLDKCGLIDRDGRILPVNND